MTCSLGIQMLSLRRRHCKMIISLFCKDSDFCLPRTQNNVLPISGYHQCMFLCESEEVGKKLLFFRTPSDWSNLSRQLSVIIQLLLKCFILNLFVQFKVVTLLSHFFYLVFSLLYVVRAVTVDSHLLFLCLRLFCFLFVRASLGSP